MIKKSIATIAILMATAGFAQDSKTVFSGNADFYYRYDFANAGVGVTNNNTSFTNSHDSFELGMASIKASHTEGKASVLADLGFGKRASEFTYNDKETQFMIKQLNMTYNFSERFKITAGSFATHLGYELVDAVDNKNYSMSYAFTNGPFFNTGVKATFTSGKLNLMAGVVNPTDFKTAVEANTNQKTIIGQLGYTADSGSIYLNFTTGAAVVKSTIPDPLAPIQPATIDIFTKTSRQQIDLVASKKLTDKFTLGFNGTYATVAVDLPGVDATNWMSGIVYAQYATSAASTLAYRFEYFSDRTTGIIVPENNIVANTLSMNFKEGKFTFIPEIRFDMSTQEIFKKNKNLFDTSKTAGSILFATTYSF